MRTVNIVLLVLAGALSGALLMKVTQRPVRIAARPVALPAPPIETKPGQLSEARPPERAAPPVPSAESKPVQLSQTQPAPLETEQAVELKPSPMRRVPVTVPAALSPRSHHIPPQRVEFEASRAPVSAASMPSPPPVSPEQPKETPPARMEPENVTPPLAPIVPAPQPHQATLNAGMLIPVRLLDSLSSERNQAGDAFAATLDRELVANGFVVAERGARVEGRVTAAGRSGRNLSLELTFVHTSDGQDVALQTDRFDKQSEPERAAAAAKIGAGAAIGAVVGGFAGGGKGAAIGAGAGGGIGAGDVVLGRQPATLRSETRLTFRLRAPVTVTERIQY